MKIIFPRLQNSHTSRRENTICRYFKKNSPFPSLSLYFHFSILVLYSNGVNFFTQPFWMHILFFYVLDITCFSQFFTYKVQPNFYSIVLLYIFFSLLLVRKCRILNNQVHIMCEVQRRFNRKTHYISYVGLAFWF